MKILVLESDRRAADDSVELLSRAGHDVVRCHERGERPFPCAALRDGVGCPLDQWVDVALTVRAHPYPRPTPSEDGVICALRHGVPLAAAGALALSPFAQWTAAVADDGDVVSACERAAAAPLARESSLALAEAQRLVAAAGLASEEVDVVATREAGRIRADVRLPAAADPRLRDVVAVRIVGVVRAANAYAPVVDVSVAAS